MFNPFGKAISEVTEADLQEKLIGRVAESKNIDFKQELPKGSDEDKKEFLADISAFANASGGYILFGVNEENGLATELSGVSAEDADKEILRLVNLLQDGIQPRIPNVDFTSISLSNGKFIIIGNIPKSFNPPHVVDFKNRWRFYARNSAGKYPLDVDEVRSAFLLSENLNTQIRNFRADRIAKIMVDETPVILEGRAKFILHLIPLSTYQNNIINIQEVSRSLRDYPLGREMRINFDGILWWNQPPDTLSLSYIQLFKDGVLEYVNTRFTKNNLILVTSFEAEMIKFVNEALKIYKNIAISTPYLVFVSLIGIKNYELQHNISLLRYDTESVYPIDRDILLLPDISIESSTELNLGKALRPVFDSIWNSCGWLGSFNYDENGNWKLYSEQSRYK